MSYLLSVTVLGERVNDGSALAADTERIVLQWYEHTALSGQIIKSTSRVYHATDGLKNPRGEAITSRTPQKIHDGNNKTRSARTHPDTTPSQGHAVNLEKVRVPWRTFQTGAQSSDAPIVTQLPDGFDGSSCQDLRRGCFPDFRFQGPLVGSPFRSDSRDPEDGQKTHASRRFS